MRADKPCVYVRRLFSCVSPLASLSHGRWRPRGDEPDDTHTEQNFLEFEDAGCVLPGAAEVDALGDGRFLCLILCPLLAACVKVEFGAMGDGTYNVRLIRHLVLLVPLSALCFVPLCSCKTSAEGRFRTCDWKGRGGEPGGTQPKPDELLCQRIIVRSPFCVPGSQDSDHAAFRKGFVRA